MHVRVDLGPIVDGTDEKPPFTRAVLLVGPMSSLAHGAAPLALRIIN